MFLCAECVLGVDGRQVRTKKERNLPYGCHAQCRFSVWGDNAGVTNPESKGNRHVL